MSETTLYDPVKEILRPKNRFFEWLNNMPVIPRQGFMLIVLYAAFKIAQMFGNFIAMR